MAHDQNLDVRNFLPDSPRGVESASTGHADIQENQIGPQFARFLERLRSVCGLPANLPACLVGKKTAYAASNQLMIICNENSQ